MHVMRTFGQQTIDQADHLSRGRLIKNHQLASYKAITEISSSIIHTSDRAYIFVCLGIINGRGFPDLCIINGHRFSYLGMISGRRFRR